MLGYQTMRTTLLMGVAFLSWVVVLPGCGGPAPVELVKLGVSEFQLGRLDKARTALQQALDREPSNPAALFYMARIHHAEESYAQAIYYYQCCLDADPGYPEVTRYLDEAQLQAGSGGRELRFIPNVLE